MKEKNKVGRPVLPPDLKAKNCTFKLYSWEIQQVKDFIKSIRNNTIKCILFLSVILLSCIPIHAASIVAHINSPRNVNWDISELKYHENYYKGQFTTDVSAHSFGYYKNGKYIDTTLYPENNWGGWKYYVKHSDCLQCMYMYEDTLASTFYFKPETKSYIEYTPKGLKAKGELVAKYKYVDDYEFHKLSPQDELISIFSKKKNSLKYWYEYTPDGNIKTKHLTKILPFQPTCDINDTKRIMEKIKNNDY